MAFDTYMMFRDSGGAALTGESQISLNKGSESKLGQDIEEGKVFEIDSFSFDIEQVLNIGSQSSGIGAGKVNFNPFQIERKSDRISGTLFKMCCSGEHFKEVQLYLRRSGGTGGSTATSQTSGQTFLRFDFALVGVKTMEWSGSDGDEACKESIQFEYGALRIRYLQQDEAGKSSIDALAGTWNRIYNNAQFENIVAKK